LPLCTWNSNSSYCGRIMVPPSRAACIREIKLRTNGHKSEEEEEDGKLPSADNAETSSFELSTNTLLS